MNIMTFFVLIFENIFQELCPPRRKKQNIGNLINLFNIFAFIKNRLIINKLWWFLSFIVSILLQSGDNAEKSWQGRTIEQSEGDQDSASGGRLAITAHLLSPGQYVT